MKRGVLDCVVSSPSLPVRAVRVCFFLLLRRRLFLLLLLLSLSSLSLGQDEAIGSSIS